MPAPGARPATPEEIEQADRISLGLGAFRRGWEGLKEEVGGLVPSGPIPEDPREAFRRAFRAVERTEKPALIGGVSAAAGAAKMLADFGEAGRRALGPAVKEVAAPFAEAVGAAIPGAGSWRFYGRPSGLVRPEMPNQGPEGERVVDQMMEELDDAFARYRSAEFGKFVGKWVPQFLGSMKLAGFFQRGILQEGPALMAGAGRSRMANWFSVRAATATAQAGDRILAEQALRGAGKLVGPMPFAERAMVAAANGMGFGVPEAVLAYGQGAPAGEALRHGATTARNIMAVEMGMVGAGRALFPSFRQGKVYIDKLAKRAAQTMPATRLKILAGDVSELRAVRPGSKSWQMQCEDKSGIDLLTPGERAYAKLVDQGVIEMNQELVRATKDLTVQERANLVKRMAQDLKDQEEAVARYEFGQALNIPEYWTGSRAEAGRRLAKALKPSREAATTLWAAAQNIRSSGLLESRSPNLRMALTDTPKCPQVLFRELEEEGWAELAEGTGSRAEAWANAVRRTWKSPYANMLEGWKIKFASAPRALARELGVAGLRFLELVEEANMFIRLNRVKVHQELTDLSNRYQELGISPNEVRDAWESTRSIEAIKGQFGSEAGDWWNMVVAQPLEFYGKALQKIGVNAMMSDLERELLGTPGYFPQVLKASTQVGRVEAAIRRALAREGKRPGEVDDIIGLTGWRSSGAKKFGTIDFQRTMPGTTKEKLTRGLPFEEDAIQALRDHFDSSVVRLGMGVRFGPNWELGKMYKAAMLAEGGSERAANHLVDSALFERTVDGFAARLARNITAAQIIMKLSWAAIPNAFQSAMTGVRFGPKATALAVKEANQDILSNARILNADLRKAIASADKETVAGAQSFLERSLLSTATVFEHGRPRTLLEKVAERMMGMTQFTRTERMNRIIAAHAALADTRWTVSKIARGDLRGRSYVDARRGLDSLGVDIDQVMARYAKTGKLGLTAKQIDSVITNGVRQTQFSTGVMDVPAFWRTPAGRVIFQFKTFAFNAGRLTRDQVLREFDHGNYKPLFYWLGLGGLSGEAIASLRQAATGKQRERPTGAFRLMEDLSYFGGFALASDIVQAALYQRLPEYGMGPMTSDILGREGVVASGIQAVAEGKPSVALRPLARQPVTQMVKRGIQGVWYGVDAAADAIEGGWDWDPWGGSKQPSAEGEVSLEEWRRRMREGRER